MVIQRPGFGLSRLKHNSTESWFTEVYSYSPALSIAVAVVHVQQVNIQIHITEREIG